ncbi:MAG: HAD-IA family hydrolase [Ilumatobacteraceae bacterium]
MFDAVLLDFYGTVVHEDDVVVEQICSDISRSAPHRVNATEIGRYWAASFSDRTGRSHGNRFRQQRRIEMDALAATLAHFSSPLDADLLIGPLFEFWERPPAFPDALAFLATVDVPVVVVSNIDRADITAAITHHAFKFHDVVTSEDVRSYKPLSEPFRAGLEAAGSRPDRVLHIGDSLTSDVVGARRLGIPAAWVNRRGRPSPSIDTPTIEVSTLSGLALTLQHETGLSEDTATSPTPQSDITARRPSTTRNSR